MRINPLEGEPEELQALAYEYLRESEELQASYEYLREHVLRAYAAGYRAAMEEMTPARDALLRLGEQAEQRQKPGEEAFWEAFRKFANGPAPAEDCDICQTTGGCRCNEGNR